MTKDKARKRVARQFAEDNGTSYTRAARITAATIDPALLVPYPDELARPVDAGEEWRPVATEELGWRVLSAGATPAQRARAESVWRPVTAERPCRCFGKCLHGQPCGNGEDGIGSCDGRLVHHDRLAASLLSVDGWYDVYECDTCAEQFEISVDLPEVPWGERVDNSIRQFEGVRRITFYDSAPGECPECNDQPCRCDEVYCDECGADSHYRCSCDEYEYA
jgi:hypothetical protein